MTTRINARLDDELAAKIDEIRRRTGMTLTQIVETALKDWSEREGRGAPGALSAFEAAGFVGSGRGPVDLARNAKAELTRSLKTKT
jgi:hypothetical protein